MIMSGKETRQRGSLGHPKTYDENKYTVFLTNPEVLVRNLESAKDQKRHLHRKTHVDSY